MCLVETGKLMSVVEVCTASTTAQVPVPKKRYRLFVNDQNSGSQFLIDSGADVSIIPAHKNDKPDNTYKLYAANGTEIATYGLKVLTLDLGLRRPFQWTFIKTKVAKGIIGADFLYHFGLNLNLRNKMLVDSTTKLKTNGVIMPINFNSSISTLNRDSNIIDLLKLYPEITKPTLVPNSVKHEVKHFINTEGTPVFCRPRQLEPAKLALAKQEFEFMLPHNIIRPSHSQWVSPLSKKMEAQEYVGTTDD